MIPLYDTVRTPIFPVINWMLVGLNAFAFLREIGMEAAELQSFLFTNGLIPAQLITNPEGEWTTMFSSMFLHGGWFHIISNMWVLLIFGDNVEAGMGKIRYLIFYLLSGVAAGLLQTYVLPGSMVPMVGASGALAGVLGAYLILVPGSRIASLVPILFFFTIIEIPAVLFLVFWFVSQLYSGLGALQGGVESGIAWWAHIGGFAFGVIMVFLFRRRTPYRIDYRRDYGS